MEFLRKKNFWIYLTAIVTILFLAYVILFRQPLRLPEQEVKQLPPDSAFVEFLEDEMDYRTDFSIHLVDQRIERLKDIALIYPEKKFKAQMVIDSLQARLERGAVIKKKDADD